MARVSVFQIGTRTLLTVAFCVIVLVSSVSVAGLVQTSSATSLYDSPTNETEREQPLQNVSSLELGSGSELAPKYAFGTSYTNKTSREARNKVEVVFKLSSNNPANRAILQQYGAIISAQHDKRVQARISLQNISWYENQSFIQSVSRPTYGITSASSQGAKVLHATDVHDSGITGENVKIGVLSVEGFDTSNPEIANNIAEYKSFTSSGITNDGRFRHGTGVAETVVATAPDSEIYLSNFNTGVEYANAIDWMKQHNVDVIVMSVSFFTQPLDGSGFISSEADQAVKDGHLWINSAGNYAQKHRAGRFSDTDDDGIHNFDTNDELNALNNGQPLAEGTSIGIALTWDDWPVSSQDYDLALVDSSGSVVARSTRIQDGNDEPYELIRGEIPVEDTYYVAINKTNADGTASLELFFYDNSGRPEYNTERSSVTAPAVGDRTLSIGAVPYNNPSQLEPFSSHGPTNDGDIGVNFVSPDRVRTTTYPNGFPGTSQAAPHAAGAAALLYAANDTLSPPEAVEVLEETAVDINTPGVDEATGYGVINVSAAVRTVRQNIPPLADAGPNITINSARRAVLNGSNSSDPDGTSLSYNWTQTTGQPVQINNSSTATPDFITPDVNENEILEFRLTVIDNNGESATDNMSVLVTAGNKRPSVTLSPKTSTVAPGSTQKYKVTVDNITDGVGAYNITYSLNSSIASITDVTNQLRLSRPLLTRSTINPENQSATMAYSIGNSTDSGPVTISTITVQGEKAGSTTLEMAINTLGKESGEAYQIGSTSNSTLSVKNSLTNESKPVSIGLIPESATIKKNQTATYDISANNVSDGISRYNLSISINGTAASITNLSNNLQLSTPTQQVARVGPDQQSGVLSYSVTKSNETGNITVGSVTVRGDSSGQDSIYIEKANISSNSGIQYTLTSRTSASVNITSINSNPVVVGSAPAQNVDNDRQLEDVNGDGDANILDVVGLYQNIPSEVIENNIALFDLNNDQRVSILDVTPLYNEIAAS